MPSRHRCPSGFGGLSTLICAASRSITACCHSGRSRSGLILQRVAFHDLSQTSADGRTMLRNLLRLGTLPTTPIAAQGGWQLELSRSHLGPGTSLSFV